MFSDERNCYTSFYFLIRDSHEVPLEGKEHFGHGIEVLIA